MLLKKLKIYLDNCCFCRPFDDQSNDKIRLESEAILTIIDRCEMGKWDIIKSDVSLDEIIGIPNEIKKRKVLSLYSSALINISLNKDIVAHAKELLKLNIAPFDALHLACAEYGEADIFLTTDKKLINMSKKAKLKTKVLNPAVWLMEVL